MTPFVFFRLKSSLKDPLLFYSPHQMTPYFLLSSLKDPLSLYLVCYWKTPNLGVVSTHPRHSHMWVPSPPALVTNPKTQATVNVYTYFGLVITCFHTKSKISINIHLEDDDDLGKVKQFPTVKRRRSMTKLTVNKQLATSWPSGQYNVTPKATHYESSSWKYWKYELENCEL